MRQQLVNSKNWYNPEKSVDIITFTVPEKCHLPSREVTLVSTSKNTFIARIAGLHTTHEEISDDMIVDWLVMYDLKIKDERLLKLLDEHEV